MKNKIALASAFLLASGLFCAKAQASDTVDVNFSGTVANDCSLTLVSAGILVAGTLGPDGNPVLTSDPAYSAPGAAGGEVHLNCTGTSATISVADPVAVTGLPNESFKNATVFKDSATTSTNVIAMSQGSQTGSVASNGSNVPLYVHVLVTNGNQPIPPGTYSYTVTVTATDD